LKFRRYGGAMTVAVRVSILAAVFLAATSLNELSAETGNPVDDGCTNETNADLRIGYCTNVIESGRYTGAEAAWAFNNRGIAYKNKGDYDRAIADYDEAIRLNPELEEAFNNRGVAYESKGNYYRAIADYDAAIRLNLDNPNALNNRGRTYEDLGQ